MRSAGRVLGAAALLVAGSLGAQQARHRPPCSATERLEGGWCYPPTPAVADRPSAERRPRPAARPARGPLEILIRGGTVMGVQIVPFFIDRTEVTVAAYRACTSCTTPNTDERPCNWGRSGRDNHPINCVDAMQADAYCAWRGGRLPTQQEWQLAAQGEEGREYPWGDAEPSTQLCWSGVRTRTGTCVVGSFPSGRSPFGLEDMSGNVGEWTSSSENSFRYYRGGCWNDSDPDGLRMNYLIGTAPSDRSSGVGFRCARGAP